VCGEEGKGKGKGGGWRVRCVVFRGDWLCLRLNEKIGVVMGREMLGGV
jgi:hypothetical protein